MLRGLMCSRFVRDEGHSLRAPLNQLWKENFVSAEKTKLVRMGIGDLRRTAATEPDSMRNIVFLEEEGGDRRLSIWVGETEATALAVTLENVRLPRPWTHQFAASLLRAAGGQLQEIRIIELTDFTFYAQVVLTDGTTVDARPSDALVLALHLVAPIYVAEAILGQTASQTAADSSTIGGPRKVREDANAIAADTRRRLKAEAEMIDALTR
jgi:bifunctional DNase/RNase